MSDGAQQIAAERYRQIQSEGFAAEHDAGHAADLVGAAAGYAFFQHVTLENGYSREEALTMGGDLRPPGFPVSWPWKPTGDPVRDLVKAGALIAAAIDAIDAERTAARPLDRRGFDFSGEHGHTADDERAAGA